MSVAVDRAAVISAPPCAIGAKVRKIEISYLSPSSNNLTASVTQLQHLAPRDKYSQANDTYTSVNNTACMRIVMRSAAGKKEGSGKICIQAIAQF